MTVSHSPSVDLDTHEAGPPYTSIAAAWALVAGGIHLVLVPEHAELSWVFGTFFAAVGLGQVLLALALLRPRSPRLLVAAVLAQLVVIVLYVASRTVDLWFMPIQHAGVHVEHLPTANGIGNGIPVHIGSRMEPVGGLDLLCLGAELAVVLLLTLALPVRHRRLVTSTMFWIGLALLLARGFGLLL